MSAKRIHFHPCAQGVALTAVWLLASPMAQAQVQAISSATVNYETYANTNYNYSTAGGGSSYFPSGTVYNMRFNEGASNHMVLGKVTVGARSFDGVALAGQINIARATNAPIMGLHHIVLYEQLSNSGSNVLLKSNYAATMEESLRTRLINHGADNVFSDQGDSNGNNNNIQRIDYLFPDGLPVHSHVEQRGFLVMDRGGNDRFKIAAVKSLDANGKPASFGPAVSVLETNWGASGISLDTIVLRGYTASGDPQHPSADVDPQPLSGVFLNWQALGLATNDLFYGYALAANDTTTNGAYWTQIDNPAYFPTNTSPDSTYGGLDLISGGLMFYDEALNVALGDRAWEDLDANGVQDVGEPGISNVLVHVFDAASNLAAVLRTDTNGVWLSKGHGPGTYFAKFFLPDGYEFTARYAGSDPAIDSDADLATGLTASFAMGTGQTNLTLDAGLYRRAAIGDFVWEDLDGDGQQDGGEPGLADVGVRLFTAASNVIGTTTSSAAGAYAFTNLLPGASYFVDFAPPAGYLFTTSNVGADATDSDPLPGTNRTALVGLVSGRMNLTVDAGFYRLASLGDFTWEDANGNGQQNGGEPALADVVVTLYDAASNVVGTTTSTMAGAYAFADLVPGIYFVEFAPPSGYFGTSANVGDDATDSDADPATGRTAPFLLPSGQTDLTADAGFGQPASLGDYTWVDSDFNGQQDVGEPALANVGVALYDEAFNVVGVATSSAAGAYAFANLPPGTYFVGFTPPAGYQFTTANVGNDATDSDPDPLTGLTAAIVLAGGDNDLTVDAGFVLPASVGDRTWVDGDYDGQQDGGEPALANVVVTLYDVASNVVGTTTSSAAGAYAFTNLPPGTYFAGFAPPAGYQFTTANLGADATDSDADPATGRTAPFALTNGQADVTIDAGFYNPASVSLKLFKSSSLSGNWNLGETNDYYLTLQNTGTVALAGVALTDLLPPGVSFVPGSAQIVRMTTVTTNPFAGTVSDGFGTASYANNDGTDNWQGSWAEVGDNASAASGSVLVRVAGGTNALVFENSSADNDYVTRTNVLAAAPGRVYTNLTLSFAYRRQNWDSGDSFTFYVSTNGFVGQSNLVFAVPTTAGNDASNVQVSTNLTSRLGANLALRLRAGGSFGNSDRISFDFVTIAHSGYDVATNAATTYAPGVAVTVVSNLAGATPTNLLSNYTVAAGTAVTVRIRATLDAPLVATQFVNVALATNPATPPLTASVTNVSVANAVGDRTWFDADGDGIQDGGEPGLTGVTVRIYGAASNLIATTTSGVAGAYAFANLPSGSYFLEFDVPPNHAASPQDQGGSDALDSDADSATGRTATFALGGGANDTSRDAGFYQPLSSIGDFVWRDLNIDGLQSGGSETGMPGVVVRLYDGASNLVATTTSLVTGAYGFNGVPTATYFLEFAPPADFNFTLRDQGGDDALDSDAAPASGRTAPFFLPAGTNDLRWDAGLVEIVYGLRLTKTSDAGSCLSPGDAITYTLTVVNTGNVAQTGIAVQDLLPPGLTYVADSGQVVASNAAVRTVRDEFNAVSYSGQDGTENWAVDWQEDDPAGTAGPVGNYVGVANGRMTLHYLYVGDEAAWRWADLSAETNATLSFDWETVGLDANEYLDVQIAASPGGPFTQLGQYGGTASGAASFDVTAYISTGTTIRIEATPGTENWESGEYGYLDNVEFSSTWQSATTNSVSAPPNMLSGQTLTAGGTLTVTFQATVDAPGTVSQLVNVATAYSPRQPAIQASVTNCVATADVGVEKSVTDATPDLLETIEYTLVASNNGPSVATGVVLTDLLPAQVQYNSHSDGMYDVESGEWTIGTLAVNASTSITFNVTVREQTSGLPVTNVATVTGRDLFDPVPENDTSSVVIVPKPGVNIGNRIWFDANRDGIQNTGETNVFADIPVVLVDANGKERAATATDADGHYLFTNMPPGTYLVRFDLSSISTNEALSTAKVGDDDELDSDAIAGNVGDYAWTALFDVTSGETTHAIDLGLTTRGSSRAEMAAAWGEWTGDQGIVVWRTESEFSTAGFFVYRVDPETGVETRLNERLHLSTFREGGSTYRLADPEVREGDAGTYRLEEKELSGEIRDLGTHEIRFDVLAKTAASARTGAAQEEAGPSASRAASRASPGPSPVQKVRVRNDGVYGVDLQALADGMGLSFEAVQALAETNGLAITKHGVPVPAIYDAVRGRLVFRGEAPAPNWYVHDSAYLISAGAGLAMPRREPGASGGATVFPVRLNFEEDLFLFSMNQMPEDFYFWAGVMSGFGEMSVNRFPLDLTGYAGGDLTLNVRLMGWSSSPQQPDHLAAFGFNGTAVGSIAFDGQEAVEAVLTIPAAAVSNGVNTLSVEGVLQAGRSESFFVVDGVEASFDRALAPAAEAAVFFADGADAVSAAAFAEPLALALDADGQPTWIADANGELPAKAWAVSAGDERFVVAERAGISTLAPESAAADAWFMSETNQIDYLVVASRALAPAAQDLADYRAGQGLRSGVAVFEDVCDLLAGGEITPEAIPALLRHAATTWLKSPDMVVLTGNGHYDYLQANTGEANHLPPLLVQTPAGVCATDGRLADTGGDALPDVAIGRLPARTPAELAVMLAKSQAYEAGFGTAWQNQISLAADPADPVGDFSAENDRLAALATEPYAVAARIDLDDMAIGPARTNFRSWFNAGVGFIHFAGHGDLKTLGKSNLLASANVGALTNALRPPVLVSLTCLAARYEVPSVSSLGEALLQRAGGGAVAVLGPSGLSINAPASELGQAFYAAVFQEGEGRLGPAFLRARRALPPRVFTENTLAVYNLLGDPALRIAGNEASGVSPAEVTVTLSDLEQAYNGAPRVVSATTVPAGLAVRITYDGSTAPPTAAGTYAVAATVGTASHEGFATGLLVVAKAPATVVLDDLAQTYDGTERMAAATTEPAGLAVSFTYNGSATPPVAAGHYQVVGTVADGNHEGTATGLFVVARAPATVALDGLEHVYDGTPKHGRAITDPAGLAVVWTYDGDCTAPVGAGSYKAVAEIDEANYAGSATGTLVVAKAAATVVLEDLTQTYEGMPRSAAATTMPAGLAVELTYDGSDTPPTAAGSYAVTATVHDANYAGSATGTLEVAKAVATVMLDNLTQPYDGMPKSAAAMTDPWELDVELTYDGWHTAPMDEGQYAVSATVSDANYMGSASGTLVISAPLDPFGQWLHQQGLDPEDENFASQEDDDVDGRTTWEEYVADTSPNDADEVFAVEGQIENGALRMEFPASPDRFYQLEYSTNLSSPTIVRDLGWGGSGLYATNAPGAWFGTIRVRLAPP